MGQKISLKQLFLVFDFSNISVTNLKGPPDLPRVPLEDEPRVPVRPAVRKLLILQ